MKATLEMKAIIGLFYFETIVDSSKKIVLIPTVRSMWFQLSNHLLQRPLLIYDSNSISFKDKEEKRELLRT